MALTQEPIRCCEKMVYPERLVWDKPTRKPEGWYLGYDVYGCASCGPTTEAYEYAGRISFCPFCGERFGYTDLEKPHDD